MIYAIILTNLNEEDKNINEIIEEKNTWNKNNMLQLFQRNASIVPASNVFEKRERERETVIWENVCNERKESVFLSLSKGKHFPLLKLLFCFNRN
jgi:ABC-type oligopeptide transport system ATPase subunit